MVGATPQCVVTVALSTFQVEEGVVVADGNEDRHQEIGESMIKRCMTHESRYQYLLQRAIAEHGMYKSCLIFFYLHTNTI